MMSPQASSVYYGPALRAQNMRKMAIEKKARLDETSPVFAIKGSPMRNEDESKEIVDYSNSKDLFDEDFDQDCDDSSDELKVNNKSKTVYQDLELYDKKGTKKVSDEISQKKRSYGPFQSRKGSGGVLLLSNYKPKEFGNSHIMLTVDGGQHLRSPGESPPKIT